MPNDVFHDESHSISEIVRRRERHIGSSLSTAYTNPLKMVRGYMQFLYDSNGIAYLDAANNVPHVGHSHPRVVKALQQQAAILNTNTRYLHDNLVDYAERLLSKFPDPLSVCYFVNSGSEANELALRLARAHTGKSELIVIDAAYHGSTGALVGISPYKYEGPGGQGAPKHVHKVMKPDPYRGPYKLDDKDAGAKYAEDVLAAINKITSSGNGVCAFVCEPLLGCGGQIIPPDGYLKHAFEHVRKAGGVCIADEVQIGFGRLGSHFWGFETQGVVPDIVTMGKPIGNGHPLGAVVTTAEIAESFDNGMEFFCTTGGNPVSCSVGMAVLDTIDEEDLQSKALRVGNHLLERLQNLKERHQLIGDVRGRGMFIGVELVLNRETLEPAAEQASYVIERMRDRGILISTDGPLHNVLKIKPPLAFGEDDADLLVATLDQILREDFLSQPTNQ